MVNGEPVACDAAEEAEITQEWADNSDPILIQQRLGAELDNRIDQELVNSDVMRAFVTVLIAEINILRQQHELPDHTLAQLIDAIKTAIKQ